MLNVFPSAEEYNAFQNELMASKEIKADNVVLYEFMHDGKMFEEYSPYIIMEFANQCGRIVLTFELLLHNYLCNSLLRDLRI